MMAAVAKQMTWEVLQRGVFHRCYHCLTQNYRRVGENYGPIFSH